MDKITVEKYVENFKAYIFSKTDLSKLSKSDLLSLIVHKAYIDAISYERHIPQSLIIQHKDKVKKLVADELANNSQEIVNDFEKWHEKFCKNADYGNKYGVWQKLINMSFKYMYCFKDIFSEYKSVWTKCHCPIDQNVINVVYCILKAERLNGGDGSNEIKKIDFNWNSISDEQYKDLQNKIGYICSKHDISKLEFDFIMWG